MTWSATGNAWMLGGQEGFGRESLSLIQKLWLVASGILLVLLESYAFGSGRNQVE